MLPPPKTFQIMNYQPIPKWDKNRPEFLKIGFILSIGFALMAFNYTTYPTDEVYEITNTLMDDKTLEIIPPRTPSEPKKLPPPPTPKIEMVIEVEPEDQPTFVETKTEEIFDEPTENTETIVDDYASPTKDVALAIVKPIIEKDPIDKGPVIFADRMPVYGECNLDDDESVRRSCTNKSVMKTIYSHVKYPQIARENEIEGTVVLSFVVTKDGSIQNLEIVRDIGGGCGTAVINAMKKLGDFYPGKHNGRPVSVIYKLPVKFKLQ